MSFYSVVNEERANLWQTFHMAVLVGVRDAWGRCHPLGQVPHEPDIIASLVKAATPIMCKALQSIFGNHAIETSIVSVYCHQTPKVVYRNMLKGSCELGDILFVHVHSDQSGRKTHNALLYQAKMSAEQPYKMPHRERDQLKLYAEWPDFEYCNSGNLNGEKRMVRPKSAHSGAQYMLIDDRGPLDLRSGLLMAPGTYPIGTCMPDDLLYDHNDIATELVNFLALRSGRQFESREDCNGSSDWSQVVWDLIGTSTLKGFTRKRTGWASNTVRMSHPEANDGYCFACTSSPVACTTTRLLLGERNTTYLFNDAGREPPNYDGESSSGQASAGISIILIETSDQGRRRSDSRVESPEL
jgi:hypothetical protein